MPAITGAFRKHPDTKEKGFWVVLNSQMGIEGFSLKELKESSNKDKKTLLESKCKRGGMKRIFVDFTDKGISIS